MPPSPPPPPPPSPPPPPPRSVLQSIDPNRAIDSPSHPSVDTDTDIDTVKKENLDRRRYLSNYNTKDKSHQQEQDKKNENENENKNKNKNNEECDSSRGQLEEAQEIGNHSYHHHRSGADNKNVENAARADLDQLDDKDFDHTQAVTQGDTQSPALSSLSLSLSPSSSALIDTNVEAATCLLELSQRVQEQAQAQLQETSNEDRHWLQSSEIEIKNRAQERTSNTNTQRTRISSPCADLTLDYTPSAFLGQDPQPSAEAWAWKFTAGARHMSHNRAFDSIKCRVIDTYSHFEHHLERGGTNSSAGNVWRLSSTLAKFSPQQDGKYVESLRGGVVYHWPRILTKGGPEGHFLTGELECAVVFITQQIILPRAARRLKLQAEYSARIASITTTVLRIVEFTYNTEHRQLTFEVLSSCELPFGRDGDEKLDRAWAETMRIFLDDAGLE